MLLLSNQKFSVSSTTAVPRRICGSQCPTAALTKGYVPEGWNQFPTPLHSREATFSLPDADPAKVPTQADDFTTTNHRRTHTYTRTFVFAPICCSAAGKILPEKFAPFTRRALGGSIPELCTEKCCDLLLPDDDSD